MATVRSFTSERMLEIENTTVVDGDVVGDNLILKTREGTEIDAGNVRGPVGSPGITVGEMNIAFPPGMIVDYVNVAAPTGWLPMIGQVVANGQTLYPALWAVLPASMKAAPPAINFPDTRGRVSIALHGGEPEYALPGQLGGSRTHTLVTAELPIHSHTIADHDHTVPQHQHSGDEHRHAIDHDHDASAVLSGQGYSLATSISQPSGGLGKVALPQIYNNVMSYQDTFNTDVHPYSGLSATIGAGGLGSTGQSAASNTGKASLGTTNTGSGSAFSMLPPFVTFLKIIKAN